MLPWIFIDISQQWPSKPTLDGVTVENTGWFVEEAAERAVAQRPINGLL
ncbi:hypothetical protein [Salinisphaera sp.]